MSSVDATWVGRVFTGTPDFEVTRREVSAFAQVVGASAPVHHDVTAAQAAGYSDLLAPATFAVKIAQAAESEYISDPAAGIDFSRVVHADEAFSYHRPILAGDRVSTAVHVDAITTRGPLTLVTTRTELTDVAGESIASVVSTLAIRGEAA